MTSPRVRSRRSVARKATLFLSRPETRKHWDTMLASKKGIKAWSRPNRVLMGQLIRSVIKFFPEEWEKHKDSIGEYLVYKCEACTKEYFANSKKQKFCSESCGEQVWASRQNKDRRKKPIASQDDTQDPSR